MTVYRFAHQDGSGAYPSETIYGRSPCLISSIIVLRIKLTPGGTACAEQDAGPSTCGKAWRFSNFTILQGVAARHGTGRAEALVGRSPNTPRARLLSSTSVFICHSEALKWQIEHREGIERKSARKLLERCKPRIQLGWERLLIRQQQLLL